MNRKVDENRKILTPAALFVKTSIHTSILQKSFNCKMINRWQEFGTKKTQCLSYTCQNWNIIERYTYAYFAPL